MVEGEPYLDEYTDKDGNKRTSLKMNGTRLVLLEGKPAGQPAAERASNPKARQSSRIDTPFDDDIPF
jgi:hypothetical protein